MTWKLEQGFTTFAIFVYPVPVPTRVSIESMTEQIVFEQLEDGEVIKRYLVSTCHDVPRLTDWLVWAQCPLPDGKSALSRLGWAQTTCILRQSQPQFLQTLTQSGGQPRSQ